MELLLDRPLCRLVVFCMRVCELGAVVDAYLRVHDASPNYLPLRVLMTCLDIRCFTAFGGAGVVVEVLPLSGRRVATGGRDMGVKK